MGRLLVVEDNSVLGMDIEAEAARLGLDVIVTRDPEAAIRIASETPIVAALVDVNLRDGYEGIEVARALSKATTAYVAFVTAYTRADLAAHTRGLEHIPIFLKPFDRETLSSLLRSFTTAERAGR